MWESVTTCTLNSTYIVKFIVYSLNYKVKLVLHDIALGKNVQGYFYLHFSQ